MGNNRGRSKVRAEADSFETGKSFVADVGKSLAKDFFLDTGVGFFEQILGLSNSSKISHEKRSHSESPITDQVKGLIFDRVTATRADKQPDTASRKVYHFEKQQSEQVNRLEAKQKPEIRAAIEYHEQFTREVMDYGRKASQREVSEMSQQIQEILQELKKLINSSQVMRMQFVEVAVERVPVEVGKYHVNFFEWMLIVIKQAKQKVDDAGVWLSTVKGKNGKKSGYWDMFKKHGTSFGLSNERAVATQVG